MQTASPVDSNVGLSHVELDCSANGPASGQLAKVVQSVEYWAVLAHVEALQLLDVVVHVLGRDHLEELHIVIGVEFRHVALGRRLRPLQV